MIKFKIYPEVKKPNIKNVEISSIAFELFEFFYKHPKNSYTTDALVLALDIDIDQLVLNLKILQNYDLILRDVSERKAKYYLNSEYSKEEYIIEKD